MTPLPTVGTFLQPPSAPILTAVQPHERLADPSVIFVWMQNPVWERVTRYKLVVKNASGQSVYVHKIRDAACLNGVCQFDLEAASVQLANGSYTWSVQAKNAAGTAKSDRQVLTINYPGSATQQGPIGGIRIIDRSPVLTWSQVDHAAQYRLRVRKNDRIVYSRWFSVTALTCDGNTCMIDLNALDVKLPYGKLRWRVDTRNKSFSPNISSSPWAKFRIIRPSN